MNYIIANPFRLGERRWKGQLLTREQIIEQYRSWLDLPEQYELVRDAKVELRGKVLGCWCAPQSCHGDVLLEIANSEEPQS